MNMKVIGRSAMQDTSFSQSKEEEEKKTTRCKSMCNEIHIFQGMACDGMASNGMRKYQIDAILKASQKYNDKTIERKTIFYFDYCNGG